MFKKRKLQEKITQEEPNQFGDLDNALKNYRKYLEKLEEENHRDSTEFKPSIKIKEITLEVNKVVPFDDDHSLRLKKDGCIEVIEHIR
ncbi:unnamed protein product [marine sediment metagenome]|uniref:Uncharacterized protein n=1 Tax=marine sediment metagenome TaxID=412755 RepID=X1F0S9_9ZZZZ